MNWFINTITFAVASVAASATVLNVGTGQQYTDVAVAVSAATPGDTVLIHPGTYRGTFWIENINGWVNERIVIRGTERSTVVFDGGTESMHFSDCSYLTLENFTVRGQIGNGMNIDDAGTIETPAHHFLIRNVTFTDMNATGNNDHLKLSGLSDFRITECLFERGSTGGSGIDMVGCFNGSIDNNSFRSQGSNAIQAKGGTRFILIRANMFVDAGQRAVNLGGSTGLQFFRPIDATFEAADLQVYANVFIRSVAPIAYVGCVRVDVANNTIIHPERWVFRVLQETVDPTRFQPCGDNSFRNNIIVYRSTISTHVNIGGNTAPETFTLSNNLWYNSDDPTRSRPSLGVMTETASIYGQDPLLVNVLTDQRLQSSSPAIGKGLLISDTLTDLSGRRFASPPSIGAYEGASTTSVSDEQTSQQLIRRISADQVKITIPPGTDVLLYVVYDLGGRIIRSSRIGEGEHIVNVSLNEFVVVK
ncbi:MAG: right-handed parallel beta-helix repeat-containing protein [Ignavibacteria bacterium]|nr:right-handed parallel beta-helix repeat-containing protein [Ignavibacteria bacterium]